MVKRKNIIYKPKDRATRIPLKHVTYSAFAKKNSFLTKHYNMTFIEKKSTCFPKSYGKIVHSISITSINNIVFSRQVEYYEWSLQIFHKINKI